MLFVFAVFLLVSAAVLSFFAAFPLMEASALLICPSCLPYFGPRIRSCGLKV